MMMMEKIHFLCFFLCFFALSLGCLSRKKAIAPLFTLIKNAEKNDKCANFSQFCQHIEMRMEEEEVKRGSRFFTGFSSLFSAKLQTFVLFTQTIFYCRFRMLLLADFSSSSHWCCWRGHSNNTMACFPLWPWAVWKFQFTNIPETLSFTSRSAGNWMKTIIRQWRRTESSQNRYSIFFYFANWYDTWSYLIHYDEVQLDFLLERKLSECS